MERQSNFELLRIVAMLLVLFLHANYFSIGEIQPIDIVENPLNSFIRILLQQLCIICVNVFVLISGWFGINPSLKGALSLLFQVVFYHIIISTIYYKIGVDIPIKSFLMGFYMGATYWYIAAYLILYTISPILNTFINNSNPKLLLSVIGGYFFLEFTYGWLCEIHGANFKGGYSALSFIGLYLLGRYLHNNSKRIVNYSIKKNLSLYLLFSLIPTLIYFFSLYKMGITAYSSPFVILSSIFFFLIFNRIKIYSKTINWLASSCFSIYLVHLHISAHQDYISLMNWGYNNFRGFYYILFVIIFAMFFGILCISIDKLRIAVWKTICRTFLNNLLNVVNNNLNKIYSKII